MNTQKSTQNCYLLTHSLVCIFLLIFQLSAYAQPPGQDTVLLTTAPNMSGGGGNSDRPGKGLDERQDMPIGLKAKIARYIALGMSRGEETQVTSSTSDRADSAGFNKTCVQEIGSATPPTGMTSGRYGPRGQDQVTVLRGDLINICR